MVSLVCHYFNQIKLKGIIMLVLNESKVRQSEEVTPNRVLELTMEFSDKGYELVEARRRAWYKYTWDNCEMINTAERPKVTHLTAN